MPVITESLLASENRSINERVLLIVLAAIQFTTILDFLIIMPLGPQYMRVFTISPGEFGVIVSAYAISAGIAGLGSALFLDQFDRKTALLFLYSGFSLGTLFCALAPTYYFLIAARVIAGAFGGVVSALILAIIGDIIPEKRRGAAMGLVMSSFSIASICGVPIGLLLATSFNWHVPFYLLAFVSVLILLFTLPMVPSLRGHLAEKSSSYASYRTFEMLLHRDHQVAFLFTAALTMSGFLIFPYISNYMVTNVGLTEKQLPLIYLCGGCFTVFSMNFIGRWSDMFGKKFIFRLVTASAIIPILAVTNLPQVNIFVALLASTLFMICMSGRGVPAMAMMTASIEAKYRGGFMSLNSAVQQFAGGIAALISGQVMGQSNGKITGYGTVGLLSVCLGLLCIYLSTFLRSVSNVKSDLVSSDSMV